MTMRGRTPTEPLATSSNDKSSRALVYDVLASEVPRGRALNTLQNSAAPHLLDLFRYHALNVLAAIRVNPACQVRNTNLISKIGSTISIRASGRSYLQRFDQAKFLRPAY